MTRSRVGKGLIQVSFAAGISQLSCSATIPALRVERGCEARLALALMQLFHLGALDGSELLFLSISFCSAS